MKALHSIELTSRCNLRCRYCPQPTMLRAKEDMTRDVFDRVLYWLREFGQEIVHLHNFGESTLHPHLLQYIDAVSDVVPDVRLSTNGVGVTREMVLGMKAAGLTLLSVSAHRPESAQWAAMYAREAGLAVDFATGPLTGSHNWAGQVNAPVAVSFECGFLAEDKASVLSDGRVAACCIDAEGVSASYTVWDDLCAVTFEPFGLCRTCHHVVPEAKFPGWRLELVEV